MESFFICAENEETDNGRIYFISSDRRRHWLPSLEVAKSYDWNLDTIVKLPEEEILRYPLSFSIAKQFESLSGFTQKLPYCRVVKGGIFRAEVWGREWFGSQFRGHGLEMGAASSPWPCNLSCKVDYADSYGELEGCKVGYENKDFVPLNFTASLEDMHNITKSDYDFIVCSHVIEHTPKVMMALKNIYEHLAINGMFVMAVPHKEYMFDKYRQTTSLSHHIDDYEKYERSRDVIHVVDYLENDQIKYSGGNADITYYVRNFLNGSNELDMHYHTFTEDSFSEIIEWFNNNIYRWSSCEIFNRIEGDIEFFVRLVK